MLKVVKQIIEVIIRNAINVDDMQFRFTPGHSTTDKTNSEKIHWKKS